eukprot:9424836-Karenia_brevis.AAC.1
MATACSPCGPAAPVAPACSGLWGVPPPCCCLWAGLCHMVFQALSLGCMPTICCNWWCMVL